MGVSDLTKRITLVTVIFTPLYYSLTKSHHGSVLVLRSLQAAIITFVKADIDTRHNVRNFRCCVID